MLWRVYLVFTILSICIADVTWQDAEPQILPRDIEHQRLQRAGLSAFRELEEAEGGEAAGEGSEAASEGSEAVEPTAEEVETDSEDGIEEETDSEHGIEEELEGEEEEFTDVELTMAWALLGFVTFNMALFYLVNYPDQDMRYYVWWVVNVTISIFMAVLLFQTVTSFLCELVFKESTTFVQIMVAFLQLVLYFFAMQISVAKLCGVLDDDPFPSTLSTEEVAQAMHVRERRMKSVSGLLAHMAGFALINFGGSLQHMSWETRERPYTFIFIPGLFFAHLFTTRFVRQFRRAIMRRRVKYHHQAHADQYSTYEQMPPAKPEEEEVEDKTGMDWCTEKWDEETYECENEIASIGISFLVVQAVRFNITGVMPNNLGIEEEDYVHSVFEIMILGGCGIFFAVSCVSIVIYLHYFEMQPIEPGTCKSFAKRAMKVLEVTMAMAFAWCLQNALKWAISTFASMHGMEPNPNGIIARVLMAVTISFLAFFIIVFLDFIYDQDCTGDTADEAISSIIRALSLLVGFCWEQSFDCCVEVLADETPHPLLMQAVLAVAVFILVYPAWRKYIIDKVLTLTRERHVRVQREKRKHHHHD